MADGRERRRSTRLHEPNLQIQPALVLVALTAGFVGLIVLTGLGGWLRPLAAAVADQPPSMMHLLRRAAEDFAIVTTVTSLLYVLCVVTVCVAYSQRLLGPAVAFRRHVEALKNGDYTSRVRLRKGDAFTDLERDLNELAEILETGAKPQAGDDAEVGRPG